MTQLLNEQNKVQFQRFCLSEISKHLDPVETIKYNDNLDLEVILWSCFRISHLTSK